MHDRVDEEGVQVTPIIRTACNAQCPKCSWRSLDSSWERDDSLTDPRADVIAEFQKHWKIAHGVRAEKCCECRGGDCHRPVGHYGACEDQYGERLPDRSQVNAPLAVPRKLKVKRLSARAEMVLGYIRECTRRDASGALTMYMVPKADPYYGTIYGERQNGFILHGAGDARIIKSLERAGLVEMMPKMNPYACATTERGDVVCEEIAARRRAGRQS